MLQRHFVYAKVGIVQKAKLIDGRAAGLKILHHLPGHRRRIGRNAARGDAMIGDEHRHPGMFELRRMPALPYGKPFGQSLQAAERAWRFGQFAFPGPSLLARRFIRARHRRQQLPHFIERRFMLRHAHTAC